MKKLLISQGDSTTIAIVLPAEKMAQVKDVVVYVGNKFVARKSNNTLVPTNVANVFQVQLSSFFTQKISGPYNIIVGVDYTDFGVKKGRQDDCLILVVKNNSNQFNNDSVSLVVDATIFVEIVQGELTQNVILATIYRGFSALDVFRVEHDMPNASNDDMLQFSLSRERRNFFVGNINYIGVAKPGSSDEQEVWKITKIEITENGGTLVTRAKNVAWNHKLHINYN